MLESEAALARRVSDPDLTVHPLEAGWELACFAGPGFPGTPEGLEAARGVEWRAAPVPGTAAQALGKDAAGLDLDACEVWYRCRFPAPDGGDGARTLLVLEGLATLGEVWLNGARLIESQEMFRAHAREVQLAARNELLLRCAPLRPLLRARRPRGRWPTRLVSEKHLRFVRTTLLGYLPGFCPPLRPVGPWRPVSLILRAGGLPLDARRLRARREGGDGLLTVTLGCRASPGLSEARLHVGDHSQPLALTPRPDGGLTLEGTLRVPDAAPWWPHTHGEPVLHEARLTARLDGHELAVGLGRVGFRNLRLRREAGAFALRCNGVELFCRGACWLPLDVASLGGTEVEYRRALEQVRAAGMNMLRLVGVGVYEPDVFHRLCDELGLLVWQDFMFANLDYPVDEPELLEACRVEARQLLERIGDRPSLAVLCGNSEVAQQAAMMGAPPEQWSNHLFERALPELCAELAPDVPWVSSSPSGGALPFHTAGDAGGPSHYYGVGAYLRPIDDARATPVRFASECLAFANVPEEPTLRAWLGEEPAPVHSPRWKERVPRDGGAGWDFADVTDHYLEVLFGVAARQLRWSDPERYLALCRATTGEVMARVQGIWRRRASSCRGALIWSLRDLWLGPGWGVIDAAGRPKAAWYYLRRAWAPRAVWLVDEATDGLGVYVENEAPEPLEARLEVELFRADGASLEKATAPCPLAAHQQRRFSVDGLVGRFVDSSWAYRFGPPAHALVAARLLGPDGAVLGRAHRAPDGPPHTGDPGLTATARAREDGSLLVTARAERWAQAVAVEAPGWQAEDAYFDLAPRESHTFRLLPVPGGPLRARLRPLNAAGATPIRLEERGA